MQELLNVARIVGPTNLLRLRKAQRRFWNGMLRGYYATHVVNTLLNTGTLEAARESGGVDPESYARAAGLNAEVLKILCEYACAIELLAPHGSVYQLTSDGELLLDVGRGWLEAIDGYADVYHNLEDILRGTKSYGREVLRNPVQIAGGSGRMEAKVFYPVAIDAIAHSGFSTVLDIGCGDGRFLIDLCRALPRVRGVGIDIEPESLQRATEQIRQQGLSDRITFHQLNLLEATELPPALSGVDAAVASFVLHEILGIDEEALVRFLQNFRRLLPGVPLLAFEPIRATREETRRSRGMSPEYYLQHDLTRQRLVGRETWLQLFKTAGFESIDERHLGFVRTSLFSLR